MQRRAYILADNKLALNSGWDEALLPIELAHLREMAFALSPIGFGEDEQARLLDRNGGLTDPDYTPEPPANPISAFGDLWLLGRHRLLCGDSTVATDFARAGRRDAASDGDRSALWASTMTRRGAIAPPQRAPSGRRKRRGQWVKW